MKRLLCLFVSLMLLCAPAFAESTDSLDDAVRKIFKVQKTVGGTVLVAKDGEIVYQLNYGYQNARKQLRVTDGTHFRIASVTKMVSAIRVMQLVEEGKLSLDAPLGDALGYTVYNPYYKSLPVTLRMVMSHTTSVKSSGGYGKRGQGVQSLLASGNKGNYYNEKPGSAYRYSNFGAGLMGSLIEQVTGKNVNDAVTEGIFAPLQMDAAYHASLIADRESITNTYDTNRGLWMTAGKSIDSNWDASVNPDKHYMITVGSLWMTGRDLCRLGIALCDGGAVDGVRLLQPETVAEMLASQQGKGGVTANTPYGLCINRNDTLVEGKMLYGHQGMSGGIVANVYFDPESRFVFTLITNGCNNKMDNHVCGIARKLLTVLWNEYGE